MTAVLFCMAMIIEIVYVFMSPVPKELENKYLLIGTAFICAADFTYHIDYTTIKNVCICTIRNNSNFNISY